ncbi:inactive pancreatic lipase-related protein 1 [Caerostris extrusa]|uniref:Inactive pancreatic lipase-related protein 1 n=1 Tax=Caerostris extrusa TaxID=172846 RepID=A0AAV4VR16_CAEEX|nr:inactive pancreatic lipase-related protein 1 [Caerostris extrusa]
MASIAILCLLLMERFLASDMDNFTEPVLNGLRVLEHRAIRYASNFAPPGFLKSRHKLARFLIFTSELSSQGKRLDLKEPRSFLYFNPRLDTKVIIHGFLDKVKIADWMHHMKDEFLMLDNFNVIVVDWSFGNFIPYSKAAANTELVGEEISVLLKKLMDEYGAKPEKFHLIGHSLGSHVAGYVGESIKGLKRITGLDPATYLFSTASQEPSWIGVTQRLWMSFIQMVEESEWALLEKGVVEGVRNVICSHMRAPLLFTDTINVRSCPMIAYRCTDWGAFSRGECDSCGRTGEDCALMGYHMDTERDYGNASKYFLFTGDTAPYCGYEYKIALERDSEDETDVKDSWRRGRGWPRAEVLQISLYGSAGNADFQIEGKSGFQKSNVLFSPFFLGDVMGAIIRWSKVPVTRTRGMMNMVSNIIMASSEDDERPFIKSIHVNSLKTHTQWKIAPIVFELCASPLLPSKSSQQGATFRSEYCL